MLSEWFGANGCARGADGPASSDISVTTCPACGYHIAVLFYDGGQQPLATLGWPRDAAAASAMPKLPLRFVRCVDCGHVFNAAFDYTRVPYTDQPNRMFNRGHRWSRFLENLRTDMLDRLPDQPVVVEIGHGEGTFLEALAAARPEGRYLGLTRTEPPNRSTPASPSIARYSLRNPISPASNPICSSAAMCSNTSPIRSASSRA